MEIINYSDREHYQEIYNWWKHYGELPPMAYALPESSGILVVKDGVRICAGWAYMPFGCNLAQIGHFVTNPEASSKDKHNALKMLTNNLEKMCFDLGYFQVNCIVSSSGMSSMLKRIGYYELKSHKYLSKKL